VGDRRHLQAARRALDDLDRAAADAASLPLRAPALSAWSVAQHVDHLAAANLLCLRAAAVLVEGTDDRILARGAPNVWGRLVLTFGHIPRGRGRAPQATVPAEEPDAATLAERLRPGREVLDALAADPDALAAARGRLPHPALGAFSAVQWVRFTAVHVRHHLAIAADLRQRSR